jgi:hypothetical protein
MSDSQEKRFQLRIAEDLYNELEAWANEEFRSVNGQILVILREAVAKRRAARGKREKTEEESLTPELALA